MQSYAEPPNDYMDLGQPDYTGWITATNNYLAAHTDTNVVMWAWCGELNWFELTDVNNYLTNMSQLETQYPGITFIYMTGHLDGQDFTDSYLDRNNTAIRNYCNTNNKILYDFADIESYDPDGNYYYNLHADDHCNYIDNEIERNWADEWCANHPGDCYFSDCGQWYGR